VAHIEHAAYFEHMQHFTSLFSALAELRDWDGVKVIADYAGLPSTSEETKVLAP